jgi:hypothetical protein
LRGDSRTSHVQQVYNTPLTWGGPYTLWDPPHVRGVLYTCCTCDVHLSFSNPICLCVFIKKSEYGFAIIAVYVDDLNPVGTPEELTKTATYLKNEFEMKDVGKTKFCLGLQIEFFQNGILVHQSTYTKKSLEALLHGEISSFEHSNGYSIT